MLRRTTLIPAIFLSLHAAASLGGPAQVTHVLQFGSTGNDVARGVAVDPNGDIYIVGTFEGTVDFGSGPLTSWRGRDVFIAKFDSQFNPLWSRRYEGSGDEDCFDVYAGAIRVFLVGSFPGVVNFGNATLGTVGLRDAWLLSLDSTGNHVWSGSFGGANDDAFHAVAAAADADLGIFVAGVQNATASSSSALLAHYTPAYTIDWNRSFGRSAHALRIVEPESRIWVGLEALPNEQHARAYTFTGGFNRARQIGTSSLTIRDIEICVDGNLALAGEAIARPYLARDNVTLKVPPGSSFGSMDGLVSTSDDRIVAAGAFRGTGWGLTSDGDSTDALVVAHHANGDLSWALSFPGPNQDRVRDLVMLPDGSFVAVGEFGGSVDFNGFSRTSAGASDIFLVRIVTFDPYISELADIGNDDGGFLRLAFDRDQLDVVGSPTPIVEYEVFRQDMAPAPPGWTLVKTMPAHAELYNRVIVSTEIDGVPSAFFVRAKTNNPAVYSDSPPASGTSLDNRAPSPPTQPRYQDGVLFWSTSSASDVVLYAVYGSHSEAFNPAAEELIGRTHNTSMEVPLDRHAFYHVTAIDDAGNESTPATLQATVDTPNSWMLTLAAYPNPFNPQTVIRFELPTSGIARVAIYDANGARVAMLVERPYGAGPHTITWAGRGDDGVRVSSGVYFARLQFAGRTLARKLVLIK